MSFVFNYLPETKEQFSAEKDSTTQKNKTEAYDDTAANDNYHNYNRGTHDY